MDQMDQTGGNTIPQSETVKKKRGIQGNRWCFTVNNWEQKHLDHLEHIFKSLGYTYIIGEEVGEQGTPHLQGYFETGGARIRPIEKLKLPFHPHFEKAKGDKAANVTYCSKEGKVHTNMKLPRPLPEISLYGWQVMAALRLETEPNQRDIFWYWSAEGAKGKSTMVRWLVRQGAVICSGKASDMKYLIVKYFEKHGVYPDDVVFDVPRSSFQYLSYTGIEEIKNGVFASTKYDCETVEMPHPRVWVFANYPPDLNNEDMSADRFRVVCVD